MSASTDDGVKHLLDAWALNLGGLRLVDEAPWFRWNGLRFKLVALSYGFECCVLVAATAETDPVRPEQSIECFHLHDEGAAISFSRFACVLPPRGNDLNLVLGILELETKGAGFTGLRISNDPTSPPIWTAPLLIQEETWLSSKPITFDL